MDQWTRPGPNGKRIKTKRHGRGKRWLARWHEAGTGKERSRAFDTKGQAEAFLARLHTQLADGTWVDPKLGLGVTVGEYADRWLKTKSGLAESTIVSYTDIRNSARFRDRWDACPVGAVTQAAVIEWMAAVLNEVSASRTRHYHVVLNGALALAVADKKIPINPARTARGGEDGVKLPRLPRPDPKAIEDAAKVEAYVAALERHSERAAVFGLTLVFSGLRFGEANRLEVADLVGRILMVEHSTATVHGRQVEADTKSHRKRQVVLPQAVADRIRELVGDRKTGPLLPAPRGGRWHHCSWTRIHKRAVAAAVIAHEDCAGAGCRGCEQGWVSAGLPEDTTTHQLRHTAVSHAIDAGASVKAVQRMVGHSTAKLTLDTYTRLRTDELEEVADALADRVPQRGVRSTPSGRPVRRLRAVQ